MGHHVGLWLRFLISVPLIFFLGRLASNFVYGYFEFLAIIVYAVFLWLVGFSAYFFAPYKLGGLAFIYLYFWAARTLVSCFKDEYLSIFEYGTINPFVFMGMLAIVCFIGLINAYKEDQHYSTAE